MPIEQLANSSPEWLVLLVIISCILPLVALPFSVLGLFGAAQRNRTRAWLRFLYLFLPWLPFAALAGLFIMNLSNVLLGGTVTAVFSAVRLYFINAQSSTNGLKAAMA